MHTKLLLISPPFTQLNTPYPATSYIKGYLNTLGVSAVQADLSLEVILSLFSRQGLEKIFDQAHTSSQGKRISDDSARILALRDEYVSTIDTVIGFLQNRLQTMAQLLADDSFLPRGRHFQQLADLEWAFGEMGYRDRARHFCTLYLDDLCGFIIELIDPNFGFSRYAEHLGRYAGSFDELESELSKPYTYIDNVLLGMLEQKIALENPTMVAITVPFPGNLYSALRCGQYIKKNYPAIIVEIGGGFPNTELRSLSDSRIFDYVDYILLDDGETPLRLLIEMVEGQRGPESLCRTYMRRDGEVRWVDSPDAVDVPFSETGTPDLTGLPLDKYLSVIEMANPMHKLWSDGRWNKLTFAHGCYWGKCTFCDGSLDYIKRYDPAPASLIADRMEQMISQTGESGFHFVDEAAPPALMCSLALEILRRKMKVTWWTNVRFEKSFTADLCRLLKQSGCIAVSGGLEVASDRLLKLINKGVTVEQVAKVASNFTESGIMVHAYLMYGFPTQSVQETIDSLEVVRQLFSAGVVQSGFWHRFAMTAHSPVGLEPERFNVNPCKGTFAGFADNDRLFEDPTGAEHEKFGEGLRKSLYNFMHGIGLDFPIDDWFEFRVPATTVHPRRIERAISQTDTLEVLRKRTLCWVGGVPQSREFESHRKGKARPMLKIVIHNRTEEVELTFPLVTGQKIMSMLESASVASAAKPLLSDFEEAITPHIEVKFEKFLQSEPMQDLLSTGLLLLSM